MCGVVGFVGQTKYPEVCLKEMVNAINHRGPDNTAHIPVLSGPR